MKEIAGVAVALIFLYILLKGHAAEEAGKRKCQHCGKMISYSADVCPYCYHNPGIDVGAEARSAGRLIKFAIKAAILVVVFYFVLSFIGII